MKKSLLVLMLITLNVTIGLSQEDSNSDGSTGIQVKLSKEKSFLSVLNCLTGFPADISGLKPGDRIFKIDDKKISDLSDPVNYLKNFPGKWVKLTVNRFGKPELFEINVPRVSSGLNDENCIPEVIIHRSFLYYFFSEYSTDSFKFRDLANIYVLNDNSRDMFKYKTYDFEFTSVDQPLIEKELFSSLESQLNSMGLSRLQEKPDLMITMSFAAGKISLKFLDAAEIESSKTPPVVWEGSVNSSNVNLIESCGRFFKEMLYQYPYAFRHTSTSYWFNLHYAYTGILYSQNDMRFVADIIPGSPADKAGIQKGDEIITINKLHLLAKYPHYSSDGRYGSGLRYTGVFVEDQVYQNAGLPAFNKTLTFEIERMNKKIRFSLEPEDKCGIYYDLPCFKE